MNTEEQFANLIERVKSVLGKIIVRLYWKFGHKYDDAWRTRLVAHFIPTLTEIKTPGTLVVSEIMKNMEKPTFNPLAEVTIHGIGKPDFVSPDIFDKASE